MNLNFRRKKRAMFSLYLSVRAETAIKKKTLKIKKRPFLFRSLCKVNSCEDLTLLIVKLNHLSDHITS